MIVGKSENDRPVAPGPPLKSVSPPYTRFAVGVVEDDPPGEWPGVCSATNVVAPTSNRVPSSIRRSGAPIRVHRVPEHQVVGVERDRRAHRVGDLHRRVDVVVVPVGAHDGHDAPPADGVDDRPGLVRGIDDQALVVVTDDPDVVVDGEVLTVDRERSRGDDVLWRGRSSGSSRET